MPSSTGISPHRDWLTFQIPFKLDIHWNTAMHCEAIIDQDWRCTPKPWLSKFGDELQGSDQVQSEMHLETMFERFQWCNLRTWVSVCGDALWHHDSASVEMTLCGHYWVRSAEYWKEVVQKRGGMAAQTLLNGWLVILKFCRGKYNMMGREMRDLLGAGESWLWDHAVLGVCCVQC